MDGLLTKMINTPLKQIENYFLIFDFSYFKR